MKRLRAHRLKPVPLLLLCVIVLSGHDIITTNLTYTHDISPILAARCLQCHDVNASIPLDSYEHARPWAVAIKEQVLARTMPPWGAIKGFGHFQPDNALSEEEMLLIAAWVVGGAPKGEGAAVSSPDPKIATPVLRDLLVVQDRAVLKQAIEVSGLKPSTQSLIDSIRVTAKLPDGRIEPLVWLYRYDPKYAHSFVLRDRVQFPAGTIIEASAPLRFALETTATSPGS